MSITVNTPDEFCDNCMMFRPHLSQMRITTWSDPYEKVVNEVTCENVRECPINGLKARVEQEKPVIDVEL